MLDSLPSEPQPSFRFTVWCRGVGARYMGRDEVQHLRLNRKAPRTEQPYPAHVIISGQEALPVGATDILEPSASQTGHATAPASLLRYAHL